MAFSTGFLRHIIYVQNRKAAQSGDFGIDGDGVEWEESGPLHASVEYARGKSAMNAGSLDAYAVCIVRMRYSKIVNMRSRIRYEGQIYQILPEFFHADYMENTIQFHMQLIVSEQ
jgi:SPP1 family predicted phage head-tail adaptor